MEKEGMTYKRAGVDIDAGQPIRRTSSENG